MQTTIVTCLQRVLTLKTNQFESYLIHVTAHIYKIICCYTSCYSTSAASRTIESINLSIAIKAFLEASLSPPDGLR